ncbi:ORF163 [Xestia c-nigrum granulovirus]|uniref:ORF163 n=1 Tax=Xestia c-nigrum granulosis virus TaxID=51677 RepID=Q9PYN3_GVXN|nr:ORF163 [Xestia c-nigrum granulovirus]AAF05277.1 ORF163 [Xestia c-nigrum granulovirus]
MTSTATTIVLTGDGLGERQRDFYRQVCAAAANGTQLTNIRPDEPILDKLFKVELALRYQNVDYLINVLKHGDMSCVTRVLQNQWVFESSFINIEYLRQHVIPVMCLRARNKLLAAIANNYQREAEEFYQYCYNERLYKTASKFLLHTSDDFKVDAIQRHGIEPGTRLQILVGRSFEVAEAYVASQKTNVAVKQLAFLFKQSEDRYLDLVEKYLNVGKGVRLNARISKRVMTDHKRRVFGRPLLYINLLHMKSIVSRSRKEDVKSFLRALLPHDAVHFWSSNYCSRYRFVIDVLQDEKFACLKELYDDAYTGEPFETTNEFVRQRCYNLMTPDERSLWAINEIAKKEADDKVWYYRFVDFTRAYEELKQVKFSDSCYKNCYHIELLQVVNIAQVDWLRHLKLILDDYYSCIDAKTIYNNKNFVQRLLERFNVYDLTVDCWHVLHKIILKCDVNTLASDCRHLKVIIISYSVLNKLPVKSLVKRSLPLINSIYFRQNLNKLSDQQKRYLLDFLYRVYINEFTKRKQDCVYGILDILHLQGKSESDIPECVAKHIITSDRCYAHKLIQSEQSNSRYNNLPNNMLHLLTQDAVANIPKIKMCLDRIKHNLLPFLKNVKIYFMQDIGKAIIEFCDTLIKSDNFYRADVATQCLFQLVDKDRVLNILKHVSHYKSVQEAICTHVCYTRPPVPVDFMLRFINENTLQFIEVSTLNFYLTSVQISECDRLIQSLLQHSDTFIKKLAITLAFRQYDTTKLCALITQRHTHDISTHAYNLLVSKIVHEKNVTLQDQLYDTLKSLTLLINVKKQTSLFKTFVRQNFPNRLLSDYLQTVWKVVSPYTNDLPLRVLEVMQHIYINISKLDRDFLHDLVSEILYDDGQHPIKSENYFHVNYIKSLSTCKNQLALDYILHSDTVDKTLDLLKKYVAHCFRGDSDQIDKCFNFITSIERNTYQCDRKRYVSLNYILTELMTQIENTSAYECSYLLLWELKVGLILRKIMPTNRTNNRLTLDETYMEPVTIANQLYKLIASYIQNDMFFVTMHDEVSSIIYKQMVRSYDRVHFDEYVILVCLELMKFNEPRLHLLIVYILPKHYRPQYFDKFGILLKQLKSVGDTETSIHLYKKYPDFV